MVSTLFRTDARKRYKQSRHKKCIENGEIIEDYPEDFPHLSCLIFGYNVNNKVIHVVVGKDSAFIYIITAYIPNTTKFENDLKTRRGVKICVCFVNAIQYNRQQQHMLLIIKIV